MSEQKFGYATYREAETWSAIDGDTREEAAINALAEVPDSPSVYVCEQKPINKIPPLVWAAEVDRLLESANEYASENGIGTWYEDDIYAASREARRDLEALLEAAFSTWLAKHPGPNVWECVNITEHQRGVITERREGQ